MYLAGWKVSLPVDEVEPFQPERAGIADSAFPGKRNRISGCKATISNENSVCTLHVQAVC
jgi:hypothetical protein